MAPIKFEEDFKEKLDKRSIHPSKDVWDKLSERLETTGDQKIKNRFWWIAVAASVVGVMLVIFQFFKEEAKYIQPKIVNAPEVEGAKSNSSLSKVKEVENNTIVVVPEKKEIQDKAEGLKTEIYTKKSSNIQREKQQVVATIKERENKKIDKLKLEFETEKAQQVADVIYTLSESASGVSNTEIDSLLKQAQRDILLNRMQKQDKVLVDAALLLQEVEFELDKSFRERVFKVLKNSYGSVKTAIVQRND